MHIPRGSIAAVRFVNASVSCVLTSLTFYWVVITFKIYSFNSFRGCETLLLIIVAMVTLGPRNALLLELDACALRLPPPPNSWKPPAYSLFLWTWPLQVPPMSENIQYLPVFVWHIKRGHPIPGLKIQHRRYRRRCWDRRGETSRAVMKTQRDAKGRVEVTQKWWIK